MATYKIDELVGKKIILKQFNIKWMDNAYRDFFKKPCDVIYEETHNSPMLVPDDGGEHAYIEFGKVCHAIILTKDKNPEYFL